MARSKINTHGYNKNAKSRILSREEIAKQMHEDMNNENISFQQIQHLQYVLDSDFKKKYIQFTNDTKIITDKYPNKIASKFLEIDNINDIYTKAKPALEAIANMNDIYKNLKKSESGTELLSNVVSIEKINHANMITKANTSLITLNQALDNLKNSKSFYVFDTETYSGMGRTGYNELDGIQEIAFKKYEKIDGVLKEIEEDRLETLIGIDQKKYNEYYETFIKNYDDKIWEDNNKNRVIAERLAKLGHSDTITKDIGWGITVTEAFASDDSIDLMSKANIKKGLDEALRIGKKQDKERLDNGLMVWEDYLLRSVDALNNNFSIGFNSTNFDVEKINQDVAKIWSRLDSKNKAYYSQKLGLKNGAIPTINMKDGMNLDARDVVRMYSELYGKTSLYDVEDLKNIKKIGKTLLQQEVLGSVYAKEAMKISSHTAGADVDVLAQLVAGNINNGKSLIEDLVEKINKKVTTASGQIDNNSVLMATQIESFNDFARKGALNFTQDRLTGSIRTFNGYSLDKDGDIRNLENFGKATGIKKNVAYRIGFMGEVDTNEEWVKNISKAHQDYAQGKLWAATLNPVIDKTIAGENNILEDPTTYIFTSKQAMEGFFSSHFAHIGNIDKSGKIQDLDDPAARAKIKEMFGIHTIKDGKVSEAASQSVEQLVANGTRQAMNDPAARMIRNHEYSKAIKFKELQDHLIKNGYDTVEKQKMIISQATAEDVANGKPLKIKHDIIKIIEDKDFSTNKKVIHSSTMNNIINSYEYMSSLRGVIDQVISEVDGYGDIKSDKKQYIYQTLMSGLIDDAEAEFGSTNKLLNVYGKDLNYFEINMPNGYFNKIKKKSMPKDTDDIIRINLAPEKEFSLVNDLLRKRKDSDRILNNKELREIYGKRELISFMNEVNTMEEYKGIFDELLTNKVIDNIEVLGAANEDIGVDALSEKAILSIRDFRSKNPMAGYVKDRDYQDVTSPYEHAIRMDKDFISKSIKKSKKGLSDIETIDSTDKLSIQQQVERLVDNALMPTIIDKNGNKIKDISAIAEHAQKVYGYNKELYESLLETAREDHIKGMTSFIAPVIKNGGKISYDKKTGQIGLEINNEMFNLRSFGKINFQDGITSIKTGQNEVELIFKLNGQQAISKNGLDKTKIGITTNLAPAYDELKYLGYQLNTAMKNGDPKEVTNKIMRSYGRMGSKLREGSALGENTAKDVLAYQHIDINDIYKLMPHFMDEIESYNKWVDEGFTEIIKNNKYAIENGILNSEVQEATAKNIQDLAKIMLNIGAGQKNQGRNRNEKILQAMNISSKDTNLSAGKRFVGEANYLALGEFDNPSRPVINQMLNAAIHKKDDLIELSSEMQSKKIDVGTRLVTSKHKGLFNRYITGLGETETTITQTTAVISEKDFRKRVLATYNELKNNGSKADKERTEKIYKYMTSINLTEQGKIIDGRVAKKLMSTNEIQVINTLKDFNRDLEVNSQLMNERVAKAMPIIEIADDGEIVFKLGKKSFVRKNEPLLALKGYGDVDDVIGSKGDFGHFSYGYFAKNSNQMIDEKTIKEFLEANKDEIMKAGNADERANYARKIIEETFDAKFYVKNATYKGYYKGIYEGVEKGMFNALLMGAGELDESVGKALELTGFGDMKYRILGDDFINETLKESYNALSKKDKKALGFSSFEELKDRIYKEQLAPTEFFSMMKGFEDVTSVSVDNVLKHRNAGMATRMMIQNMAHGYSLDGHSIDEAYEMVSKKLKDHDVFNGVDFEFKDGKIEFNIKNQLNAEISIDNVKDFMQENIEAFEWMKVKDLDGKYIEGLTKTRHSLLAQHDYTGTSRSSNFTGIDEEIKTARNQLSKLDPNSNEFVEMQDKLKGLEQKRKVMTNFDKRMKISPREMNMLELHEYDGRFIEDTKSVLNENEFKALYGDITDSSGNILKQFNGKRIHDQFLNRLEDQVAQKAKENSQYVSGAANALRFNKDKRSVDSEYLLNNGFESKNISDLIFAEGTDTKFLENDPNRAFGKNLLINTGLKSKGYDKVAISATKYKTTSDMVNNDEVQKALMRMQDAYSAWKTPNGTKTRDELERVYMRSIDNVKDAMDIEARKIIEDSRTIELGGYNYEKASMAMFDKNNLEGNYHMYNQSSIVNISKNGEIASATIGDLAKKDIHVGASWHGISHFENRGYFTEEYMKEHGFESREEVMKWLETYGDMGLEERTPSTKDGSILPTRQFLDRTLKDESKATAPLVARRNQDHDGDSIIQSEIRFEKTGDTYATHLRKLEQKKEVSQEQIDFFNSINSAINYEATTTNVGAYNKMFETYKKDSEVARQAVGNYGKQIPGIMDSDDIGPLGVYNKTGILDGKVNTFMQQEIDTATRNEYLSKYGEIENAVKSQMGEREYKNLDRLDRVAKLEEYIKGNSLSESYNEAVKFAEIYEQSNQVVMSKSSKGSIGYMNTPLASLRRVAEADGMDSTSRQYLQAASFVLEESMISRKHSASSAISKTQKVRESLGDIARGDGAKSEEALNFIKNLFTETLDDDIANEILSGNSIYDLKGLSNEEAIVKIKEGVHGALDDIAGRFENNKSLGEQYFSENINNLRRDTIDKFANGYQNLNNESGKILADNLGGRKYYNPKFNTDGFKRTTQNFVQEAGEAIQSAGSNNGFGLAKAALGVAAAVMMTGYIGGNPTAPADNQAEQMSNYDSLQDEDLSIQSLPQGTGQGYVININAQTPKGQEHAMQAIQKAVESSVTTDVNILMNINDRTSNINSRFIDKLLTGAL